MRNNKKEGRIGLSKHVYMSIYECIMRQFWMSHCFVPSREEWTHKREWTIPKWLFSKKLNRENFYFLESKILLRLVRVIKNLTLLITIL